MEKVRFAVVGTEGIGVSHIKGIHNIAEATLAAVCDIDESYAKKAAEQNGLDRYFTDYDQMISAGSASRKVTCTQRVARATSQSLSAAGVVDPAVFMARDSPSERAETQESIVSGR